MLECLVPSMNTTLLVATPLIGGFQDSLGMVCLGVSIFVSHWIRKFQWAGMSDWQMLVTVMLFSLCYVLGIIIHQIADTIFLSWENRIKGKIVPGSSILANKIGLGLADEHLTRQIKSARSRMRIARAVALNCGLAPIFALGFIAIQWQTLTSSERWGLLCFALIVGVMLMGVATFTWQSFTRGYYEMVKKHLDAHPS